MIIVMAGLPGTGKSTLARELAARIGGVVLSKDDVRSAAFPASVRDYSDEQDDLVMEMVYEAAAYISRRFPRLPVLLDGRTFSKARQVERLLAWANSIGVSPKWVECVCDPETARRRLEPPQTSAENRNYDLYRKLNADAAPLLIEKVLVDTGKLPLEAAATLVQRALSSNPVTATWDLV